MEGIKEESVGLLFNVQVEVQDNPIVDEAQADTPPAAQAAGAPAAPAQQRPAQQQPQQRPAQQAGRRRQPAHAKGSAPAREEQAAPGQAGPPRPAVPAGLAARGGSRRPAQLEYSAPSVDGGNSVERRTESGGDGDFARAGRNDPCPCGSGRKYKHCHGDPRTRGA
jgi:preprotein translocase subunit SecA